MNSCAFVFSFVMLIYAFLKYKKILQPLVVFNFIWVIIFFLEQLKLYNLLQAEQHYYTYMLIGIVAFNFGYIIWSCFRKYGRIVFRPNINSKKKYEVRYGLLYILAGLCIMYYLKNATVSFIMLLNGSSMSIVRDLAQSNEVVYMLIWEKILNAIGVLVLIPGSHVIQVVGVFDFWITKNKKLFLLSIILVVLIAIGEGGRTTIVNFLFYFWIGYSIYGKSNKYVKNRKYIFKFVIAMIVVLLFWFTVSRSGELLQKNLYLYFSMQPYMFNIWGKVVEENNLFGYGNAAFNGFSFAILYIIKNILDIDFPNHWKEVYDLIRNTDSQWQIITSTFTRANAYVTCFWFFYLDGRILGIFLGMFFYGSYIAHTYVEVKKNLNIKNLCIYAFVFQGLLWCFIRFSFSSIYYAVTYLMLVFIVFKVKK